MFASIIPLTKLPRQFGVFDYKIPEGTSVQSGSFVYVPWRGKILPGIVSQTSTETQFPVEKIKTIAEVIPLPALPDHVVSSLHMIAEHYFSALGTVAYSLIPALPKRTTFEHAMTKDEVVFVKKTSTETQTLFYHSPQQKMSIALESIASTPGATLVLTPHHDDIPFLAGQISERFPEHVVIYHGGLTPTKQWQTWQEILLGKKTIVIGTRAAILAPLQNLTLILFFESESIDHRQYDQNPRFDARQVARHIANKSEVSIIFLSQAHRPEEYSGAAENPPHHSSQIVLSTIPRQGRTTLEKLFSPPVLASIEDSLEHDKKVFIFHNRRGLSNVLYCPDCKTLFRCDRCTLPLAVHSQTLVCHHCTTSSPFPLTCHKCHGAHLTGLGTGNVKIHSLFEKQFPEATVAHWDSDTKKTELQNPLDADILIGTQLLLHDLTETVSSQPTFGTIVATCFDDMLSHAGFRTTEQTWRVAQQLRNLATVHDTVLHLQTFDGDNPLFASMLQDADVFLPNELDSRKRLGYPPAASLITITSVDRNSHALDLRMKQLHQSLSPFTDSATKLFGPMSPTPPFRHGKWRSAVAIKLSLTRENSHAQLLTFLHQLPDEFLIDRE